MKVFARNKPIGRKKGSNPHRDADDVNLTTYGRGNSLLNVFPSIILDRKKRALYEKAQEEARKRLPGLKKRKKRAEFCLPDIEEHCDPKVEAIRSGLPMESKIFLRKNYGYSHKGNRNRNQNIKRTSIRGLALEPVEMG